MSNTNSSHPTEEALYGSVFGEGDDATRRHIEECSECRDFVDSIKSITSDIAAIAESPVPGQLDDAVLAIAKRSPRNGHQAALPFWSLNPLSMTLLGAMLFVVLSFALVMLM